MSVLRAARPLAYLALGLLLTSVVHAEWKFSGYAQARYNFWDRDLGDVNDSFDVRRARISADADLNPKVSFRAQIDLDKLDDSGSGDVDLKELWIKRAVTPNVTAQLGYVCTPFGLEVPQSNATMLTLERSAAAEMLFPGQRDTGLYFHVKSTDPIIPALSFGYSNGMAKWYDEADTGSDMLLARAQWDLGKDGFFGASYRHAERTLSVAGFDTNYSNNLWGLHGRYQVLPQAALQGEFYYGEDLSADVKGWYAQGEYSLVALPVTTYYRYDVYDFGGVSDYYRHTLGAAWTVSPQEKITVQGENYHDGLPGGEYTNFAVQYQFTY